MRSPKLPDILLAIGGLLALGVLVWLFWAVTDQPAAPTTPQGIVLVTSTPTPEATPTLESVWHYIVTPTPGGELFVEPTLPPPPPVIYPSARGRSGFLFGGQVLNLNAVDKMQWAGMGWVKWQINEGDVDGLDKIKRGHEAGFKVLLTVIGSPSGVEDSAYHAQYAAYVASLAAGGADAIEVWNEPNIARDWPAGKISPITYIKILKASYQAIKAANPNTLVISAANAATLVSKSLKTANFWTETDFTTEFVQWGGLLYTDCVGVHYNIGISAPTNTDNSLKGDAAFWFLPRILKYYSTLTQGTRPVCITELGYLTDEGLDPLETVAPDFAWAKDTTLTDQGEWHALAAQTGLNTPIVEMIIVWNVDFYVYGADPHAGYAIVRQDGACPTCDALHVVLAGG
ncbi:MAG TPA: hypothetical protein VI547_13840 [Anaerolineales bacterium]|nr:hypothetical protein [Anaerolineales bacterium]